MEDLRSTYKKYKFFFFASINIISFQNGIFPKKKNTVMKTNVSFQNGIFPSTKNCDEKTIVSHCFA